MLRSNLTLITGILQKNIKVFPKTEFILQFDGCSKGNPGMAASGAVIYKNNKEIWSGSEFVGHNETNNYAEYMGLIMGLNKAIELNINELSVEGDSMIVIKQMNCEYKVKSSNLVELYKLANQLKSEFQYITFNHIYRNNNKRADELCNEAIKKNISLP
jgi:ribonuclease HI